MPMRPKQKSLQCNDSNPFFIIADLFLAFSRSASWLILFSLRRKARTAPELSKNLGMTQKKALSELDLLQRRRVLSSFTKSDKTYYRLADIRILRALELIHKISQKKLKQSKTKSPVKKASIVSRRPRA
jgi:hypothetical protein